MSPTRPTIVRDTPLLTNASPPAARTMSTTAAISASVASGAITTTMAELLLRSSMTKSPGPFRPGALVRSLASAQSLAGDRPGAGPVAKVKPVLACHGSKPSAPRRQGHHRYSRPGGPDRDGKIAAPRGAIWQLAGR